MGDKISEDTLKTFKKGVTTTSEVEAAIGPPFDSMMVGNYIVYSYRYIDYKTGIGPEKFIPIVGALTPTETKMNRQSITINFDKKTKKFIEYSISGGAVGSVSHEIKPML